MNLDVADGVEPDCSDAEHEVIEPSEPQWRRFERNVADLVAKLDPDAVVVHDYRIAGTVSGSERQVDVLVTGSIGDQSMSIAIECKRWARRLGIGAVDEFAGKLIDLGVERGVLYALNGFTAGAEARAAGAVQPQIKLKDLAPSELEPWLVGLPEFSAPDCPNENCYTGDIIWRDWPQADGSAVEAGSCDTCGTWAVCCVECGDKTGSSWTTLNALGAIGDIR